jgi:bacillithiol biosynthesis cysteine-adding enzyme BshC
MQTKRIPFPQVPQFSDRDIAYATQSSELRPFYQYEPTLGAFAQVFEDKARDATDRELLVSALRDQYAALDTPDAVAQQIERLAEEKTFTVVTAHQPSLFAGPLYFVLKIGSVLNLARQLNERYPDYHVVPVFITGGEDHDFAEINHLNLYGKTVTWEAEAGGPVGEMSTATLDGALAQLKDILGDSERAQAAYDRIERHFRSHDNYGLATIAMVNDLFGRFGLVTLGMNRSDFKRRFLPIMREELFEQPSQRYVEKAQQQLEAVGYSGQAYAREINLFYLRPGHRDRIVHESGSYQVLNSDLSFSPEEMAAELEAHPERFSPNVIMRPLFQECILPNLAYIGGGGELAYWLERKEQFAHFKLNFPMLIRRNSALWIDKGSYKRMQKLDLTVEQLFTDVEALVKEYVRGNTENELDLAAEKQQLSDLFDAIAAKAHSVDPTLAKAVEAEYTRQAKAVDNLEGRLMRAEKQRYEIGINQLRSLKDKLFPNGGLQERHDNFLPFYLAKGDEFFDLLVEHLDPLEPGLVVFIDN